MHGRHALSGTQLLEILKHAHEALGKILITLGNGSAVHMDQQLGFTLGLGCAVPNVLRKWLAALVK